MATKPKYSIRSDGRVATRIRIGTKLNGDPDYKYLCARTEKELDAKVDSYTRQSESNYVDPEKTTIAAWMDHWLNTVKKGTVEHATWEFYRCIIKTLINPSVGLKTLANLQPADIRTLYSNLRSDGLSVSRIHATHVTLNSAMAVAVEDGVILSNPCAKKTVREQAKKVDVKIERFVFAQEQIDALLASVKDNTWWRAFIHLAWASGMRREELLGLRWMDIDQKKMTVSISRAVVITQDNGIEIDNLKNDASYRTIKIDKPVMTDLLRLRSEQKESRRVVGFMQHDRDLVFSINGAVADPRQISKDFKRLALAAGLPSESHLHALRHTHATQLLKAGVHAKIVQYRLGHSSYQITMDTYSHVTPDLQDDISRVLQVIRTNKNTADKKKSRG